MSKVPRRNLLIGGVLGLIVVALIFGALRPSKKALWERSPARPMSRSFKSRRKMFPFMRNGLVRSMGW